MTKLRRRMNTQPSLPSLKAVGGLCLVVSLRTWCLTHFCINAFAMQNTRPFSIRKIHAEMGQAPTSQARPQDTDDLRPSHLAAGTLSLVEHTLSTFRGDAFPMRRRLVAAVICYVRKARSFFRRQRSQMTRHYREFWYGEGKTVSFSALWSGMCENGVLFCIGSEQKLPHHYRQHYSRV